MCRLPIELQIFYIIYRKKSNVQLPQNISFRPAAFLAHTRKTAGGKALRAGTYRTAPLTGFGYMRGRFKRRSGLKLHSKPARFDPAYLLQNLRCVPMPRITGMNYVSDFNFSVFAPAVVDKADELPIQIDPTFKARRILFPAESNQFLSGPPPVQWIQTPAP